MEDPKAKMLTPIIPGMRKVLIKEGDPEWPLRPIIRQGDPGWNQSLPLLPQAADDIAKPDDGREQPLSEGDE